jgi:hypothetical protein
MCTEALFPGDALAANLGNPWPLGQVPRTPGGFRRIITECLAHYQNPTRDSKLRTNFGLTGHESDHRGSIVITHSLRAYLYGTRLSITQLAILPYANRPGYPEMFQAAQKCALHKCKHCECRTKITVPPSP